MKVLAKVKMPKISQRDFLVAHRYTICDGMCALRGVLHSAVIYLITLSTAWSMGQQSLRMMREI